MLKLAVVFPLLMVALTALAIYVQVTSSSLSMPLATGTTILTILLPLFATANILYTPVLGRMLKNRGLQQFLPPIMQISQGILTVILATLTLQGVVPGPGLDCDIENSWQRLWHKHDAHAIERIQNTFDCCGFRSVLDRAWPRQSCPDIYDRRTSCFLPWQSSIQRTSGLEFAVAIVIGIIQLAHLAFVRRREFRADGSRAYTKRVTHPIEDGRGERLIEDGDGQYHDDEEEDGDGDGNRAHPRPDAPQNQASHRVEPSGLGRDEENQWRT
ncbi:hypothetical protein GGR57DRAFT_149790 [Xylariaceae sp. FL1272]|nr:hypothetical protein GGR57DRAFT_149790 [Xylariaceae sp. FL1272]